MGLDATVYCNCFEQGKLANQPKAEWKAYISENGCRECKSDSVDYQEEFDYWNYNIACEHEDGVAVSLNIGNSSHVNLLGSILMENKKNFPILIKHVLYSGTHCGDWIDYKTVPDLLKEVEVIKDCHFKNNNIIREFESQMRNLIDYSLKLKKPIAF